MVKKGSIIGPRPEVNLDGTPRKRPGRYTPPEDARTERLVLRVHPDLIDILQERARERGVSRSNYCEQILVGWISADPRNPKVDAIGKRVAGAPPPGQLKLKNPLRFAELWQRFTTLSTLLIGLPPKEEWFHAENEAWANQAPEEYSAPEQQEPDPAAATWAAGAKAKSKKGK